MPPRLIALDDKHSLLLDKPIMLIGRHEECDIQLESRKVSRRHCCIAQVDRHLVIRDLESTNGIRINGTQVLEGRLEEGDELTIGNLRYQVRWDDEALEARPVRPEAQGRKSRSRPAPMALPADNLVSCDIPVPLKEPGRSRGAEPAPVGPHQGTERAPESPSELKRRAARRTERQAAVAPPFPELSSSEEQVADEGRQ